MRQSCWLLTLGLSAAACGDSSRHPATKAQQIQAQGVAQAQGDTNSPTRLPPELAALDSAEIAKLPLAGDLAARANAPAAPGGVAASLDSCDRRTPRSGAALAGHVHTFKTFTLVVPDSARVAMSDAPLGGATLRWPRCRDCRFAIGVQPDSGIGLETRIARVVESQRKIDSVNKDPKTEIHEFDEIDAPPKPFETATGRGYLIDQDCGDCAAMSILFGRHGRLASIGFGGDDDVRNLGKHLCEMEVIGKTFAWLPEDRSVRR